MTSALISTEPVVDNQRFESKFFINTFTFQISLTMFGHLVDNNSTYFISFDPLLLADVLYTAFTLGSIFLDWTQTTKVYKNASASSSESPTTYPVSPLKHPVPPVICIAVLN